MKRETQHEISASALFQGIRVYTLHLRTVSSQQFPRGYILYCTIVAPLFHCRNMRSPFFFSLLLLSLFPLHHVVNSKSLAVSTQTVDGMG